MHSFENPNKLKELATQQEFSFLSLFAGITLFLPLFIIISSNGFSLPTSYYQETGFPFHFGILFFLFFLSKIKVTYNHLLIILLFTVYCMLWSNDPTRQQYLIQSFLFFLYFVFFSSLEKVQLLQIVKYGLISLKIFAFLHLVGIFYSSGLDPIAIRMNVSNFFNFPIYQSFLTYPYVLIFALLIDRHLFSNNSFSYWLFLTMVVLLEILIARKVGITLIFLYLLIFHFSSFLIASLCLSMLVYFMEINLIIFLDIVGRIFDLLDPYAQYGGFARANTVNQSLLLFQDPKILLYGNGINNYSHNYFLQIITTHGFFYFIFLFSLIAIAIFRSIQENLVFPKWGLYLLVFLLLDWSFNANLTQPYYAGILALLLVLFRYKKKLYTLGLKVN